MAATHFSGPVALGSGSIEIISADKILSAKEDNGKTLILKAATGFNVRLPKHEAGLQFKFLIGSNFITDNWVVTVPASGVATMQGNIQDGAGTSINVSDADQISFLATNEDVGDFIEMISDGIAWYVHGQVLANNAVSIP